MNLLKTILIGFIIGIANIIPGVSGGTMALVLGIYERLIKALHNISFKSVIIFFKLFTFSSQNFKEFQKEWQRLDSFFLTKIFCGALMAIFSLAKLMTYLLNNWPEYTYGFFWGLVLMSGLTPFLLIKKKSWLAGFLVIIAASGVIITSQLVRGETLLKKAQAKYELQHSQKELNIDKTQKLDPKNLIYFMIMGLVAISAMILPGISGSFLLLLMGGYFEILKAVSEKNLSLLFSFAVGSLIGLIIFSRLLNYLLKKWSDLTMSFLLGLVLGSLWVIWPFKTKVQVGDQTVYLDNFFPQDFSMVTFFTLLTIFLGIGVVLIIFQIEKRSQKIK